MNKIKYVLFILGVILAIIGASAGIILLLKIAIHIYRIGIINFILKKGF